jgi:hypothetical protein
MGSGRIANIDLLGYDLGRGHFVGPHIWVFGTNQAVLRAIWCWLVHAGDVLGQHFGLSSPPCARLE